MNGRKILAACMVLLVCALPSTAASPQKKDIMEEYVTVANWCAEQLRTLDYEKRGGYNEETVGLVIQTIDAYYHELYASPEVTSTFAPILSGAHMLLYPHLKRAGNVMDALKNIAVLPSLADWRDRHFKSGMTLIVEHLRRADSIRMCAEHNLKLWEALATKPEYSAQAFHARRYDELYRTAIDYLVLLRDMLNKYVDASNSGVVRNTVTDFIEKKESMKKRENETVGFIEDLDSFFTELEGDVKKFDKYIEMCEGAENGRERAVIKAMKNIVEALLDSIGEITFHAGKDFMHTYDDKEFQSFLESLNVFTLESPVLVLRDLYQGVLRMRERFVERINRGV